MFEAYFQMQVWKGSVKSWVFKGASVKVWWEFSCTSAAKISLFGATRKTDNLLKGKTLWKDYFKIINFFRNHYDFKNSQQW